MYGENDVVFEMIHVLVREEKEICKSRGSRNERKRTRWMKCNERRRMKTWLTKNANSEEYIYNTHWLRLKECNLKINIWHCACKY